MSYLTDNQQRMTEIIFAHRNKNYGAYQLRSTYGATMLKSVSIVALGFGSIFFTAFQLSKRPSGDPEKSSSVFNRDSTYVIPFKTEIDPPKPKEAERVETEKPSASASEDLSRNIVDSAVVSQNTATTFAVSNSTNSSTVVPEDATGTGTTASPGDTQKKGSEIGTVKIRKDYEVDSAPEFEGGLPALYSFLKKRLRYPDDAADAGIQGTVYVMFVVDETGKVTEVTALNKPGFGLQEEAERVVRSLPKFKKPAYAGGEPVKVYFQLPIKFAVR